MVLKKIYQYKSTRDFDSSIIYDFLIKLTIYNDGKVVRAYYINKRIYINTTHTSIIKEIERKYPGLFEPSTKIIAQEDNSIFFTNI